MLIRRSRKDPDEQAYYLVFAPAGTSLAELAGAIEVRFTLAMPGPDLRIDPWRAPVATLHQLAGPALPVQRRLLRAS